jgi:hypothetical protein
MSPRMLLQDRTHLTAPFLVEDWGVKTARRQDDLVAPTGAGCLCRCVHELRAIALSAQVGVDPEVLDVTTATPRSAMESCQSLAHRAFHPDGQACVVIIACLLGILGIELISQKCAVLVGGIALSLHKRRLHGWLLRFRGCTKPRIVYGHKTPTVQPVWTQSGGNVPHTAHR